MTTMMGMYGLKKPIWVRSNSTDHFTTIASGTTEAESLIILEDGSTSSDVWFGGGAAPSQRQYVINSVVLTIDDSAATAVTDDFYILFYSEPYAGAANDTDLIGSIFFDTSADAVEITAGTTQYTDTDINMNYFDESATTPPRLHVLLSCVAEGAANLEAADTPYLAVCLIPV